MRGTSVLADAALLGSLEPRLRDELVTIAAPIQLHAQEWLFLEGDVGDRLYVVLSGRLRVLVEDDDRQRVLRLLGPGAAIGELAVLTGTVRSASVQAVRDSKLLEVDGTQFRELLQRNPELGLAIATGLARQLQQSGGLQEADASPSVIAVTATPRADVEPFRTHLYSAFRDLGSAVVLGPGDVNGLGYEHWGARLAELEHEHDFVLLVAPGGAAGWPEFCLRQADRVVVVASGPPPSRDEAPPEDCDVVFLAPPDPETVRAWSAAVRPRAHHVVPSAPELPDAAHRIARRLAGRSLGLVLSGGGARAFAHVGVLEVLEDERIPVDRVGGTSMGAFIGAMVALGWSAERIRATCDAEIARRSPFSDYTLPRHSLIRARRAESMLRRLFGDTTLEELPLPLFTVSADLLSGQLVVHRTGPLVEAVGASMAIPGLAPPVSFEAQLLVDGGVLNNLPIDVMAADEPGPIVAVDVMRRLAPEDLARGPRAALPTILETLARATVLGSVSRAEANRDLASLLITPDIQELSLRDFRHAAAAMEAGRRAAEAAFAGDALEGVLADPRRAPAVVAATLS
jgi:NTE family protein